MSRKRRIVNPASNAKAPFAHTSTVHFRTSDRVECVSLPEFFFYGNNSTESSKSFVVEVKDEETAEGV